MDIVKIDRGSIEINIDGNILRVLGEAMMPAPSPQLSNYVLYANTFNWKNKDLNLPIDNKEIIAFLEKEFLKRDMKLIIE